MATTRGRRVEINQTILDQVDIFESNGFTRVVGLVPADLVSELFFNNIPQPWPLLDGTGITDEQVSAGSIYFHEIPGSLGFYNIRFRPNAVGYWRDTLTYPVGEQVFAQDFDVFTASTSSSGLKVSFIKPG